MVERRKLTKREYNRVVKEMQLDGAKAWAVAERVVDRDLAGLGREG
jgi:hypothetical protein